MKVLCAKTRSFQVKIKCIFITSYIQKHNILLVTQAGAAQVKSWLKAGFHSYQVQVISEQTRFISESNSENNTSKNKILTCMVRRRRQNSSFRGTLHQYLPRYALSQVQGARNLKSQLPSAPPHKPTEASGRHWLLVKQHFQRYRPQVPETGWLRTENFSKTSTAEITYPAQGHFIRDTWN